MRYALIYTTEECKKRKVVENANHIPRIGEEVRLKWRGGPYDIFFVKNVRHFLNDESDEEVKIPPTGWVVAEVYLELKK